MSTNVSNTEYDLLRLEANQLAIMRRLERDEKRAVQKVALEQCKPKTLDQLVTCGNNKDDDSSINCTTCAYIQGYTTELNGIQNECRFKEGFDPWIDFGLPTQDHHRFNGTLSNIPLACGVSSSSVRGGCMDMWSDSNSTGSERKRAFMDACDRAIRQAKSRPSPSPQSISIIK